MRLSENVKSNMRDSILLDLYGEPERKLLARRAEVAERNRRHYLEPFIDAFNVIPQSLITHHKEYRVEVNYRQPAHVGEGTISEIWRFTSDIALINPTEERNYSSSLPVDSILDPRLYVIAAALAEDILALAHEKEEMKEFLQTTLARHSGSIQLRKVWPDALHKYLPVAPRKKPKIPKKPKPDYEMSAKVAQPVPPASLNIRLTTNLLEGN